MTEAFGRFARWGARITGSAGAFVLALAVIVVWGVSGPIFHFNDTWQLAINTGTTIVTFLMVFLIQNTQNRDARAIHLKLDELIHSLGEARDDLVDIEHATEAEIERREKEFAVHHDEAVGTAGR